MDPWIWFKYFATWDARWRAPLYIGLFFLGLLLLGILVRYLDGTLW
jgi:hypothetical protein